MRGDRHGLPSGRGPGGGTVDAVDSKSTVLAGVRVRIPPRALVIGGVAADNGLGLSTDVP